MSENFKLKKVNKSFIPEPISYFSDSYTRRNITNVVGICTLLVWEYLGYIFGREYATPGAIDDRDGWRESVKSVRIGRIDEEAA